MKVALLLTGHMRNYEKAYENLKANLLDHHDVDIFLHSWSNRGNVVAKYTSDEKEEIEPLDVVNLYKPVRYLFEHPDKVHPNINYQQNSVVPVKNIINMYRKIYLAGELLREWDEEYDIVLRFRADLHLKQPLNLDEFKINDNNIYVRDLTNNQANDHYCIGSVNSVLVYCSLYSLIDAYYMPGRQPGEIENDGCALHAETLLRYHLEHSGLNVIEKDIGYYIWHKQ
jgi:hypothetical protein